MTKSPSRVEDAIQKELIRWLKKEYPFCKVTATRNESNRYRTDEIEVGIPDLLIRFPKEGVMHLLYFEVKTKKGRLSDVQKEWAAQPRLSNEHYGCGFGLVECKNNISAFFLLTLC